MNIFYSEEHLPSTHKSLTLNEERERERENIIVQSIQLEIKF